MSVIGGEALGRAGTQVRLAPGAPPLPEELTARSWIVADAGSGEVLAAHNAHWPLPPASTLKMLFADTVLPKLDPGQRYTARPEHFTQMGEGSSAVGVHEGESYTVEQLWHGVFLASGNDAVYALTALNGGKAKTVREMNERAEELQALDTRVVNPDGYDGPGQLSSAYDLTLFARSGMRDEDFRRYAGTVRYDFPGKTETREDEKDDGKPGGGEDETSAAKRPTFEIQTTNRLLRGTRGLDAYDGVIGVKNGYTSKAGYTFTGAAERDGRTLLVTCMHPDGGGLTVYRETAALLDWGFAAAGKVEAVGYLVPSRSEAATEVSARAAMSPPDGGTDGKNGEGEDTGRSAAPAGRELGGGTGILVITAAAVTIPLAVAAYLLLRHRRWPSSRSRTAAASPSD